MGYYEINDDVVTSLIEGRATKEYVTSGDLNALIDALAAQTKGETGGKFLLLGPPPHRCWKTMPPCDDSYVDGAIWQCQCGQAWVYKETEWNKL